MVNLAPDQYRELVSGVDSIPAQVEDRDSPCLPALERMRREAEAFDFYLRDFWNKIQPLDEHDFIDHVEKAIVGCGRPETGDVEHQFTEGICMRSLRLPQGTLCVTKIHGTQHPLAIMQGVLTIWTPDKGAITYSAPNIIITEPGTRRIVFAHTDFTAVTFHPTTETDISKIEDQIIMKHHNRLLEVAQS